MRRLRLGRAAATSYAWNIPASVDTRLNSKNALWLISSGLKLANHIFIELNALWSLCVERSGLCEQHGKDHHRRSALIIGADIQNGVEGIGKHLHRPHDVYAIHHIVQYRLQEEISGTSRLDDIASSLKLSSSRRVEIELVDFIFPRLSSHG